MVKRVKMKEFKVNMGLFDYDVIFLIGDHEKAVERVNKAHGYEYPEPDFEPRGRCFYKKGRIPFVWLPKVPKTPREIATLSHECLHAVWHVLDWAAMIKDGFIVSRDNEELMCHAMAHLVCEALTELRKRDG